MNDQDRATVARCLAEAWPRKTTRRLEVPVGAGWRRGSDDRRELRFDRLPGEAAGRRSRPAARGSVRTSSPPSGGPSRCRHGGQAVAP